MKNESAHCIDWKSLSRNALIIYAFINFSAVNGQFEGEQEGISAVIQISSRHLRRGIKELKEVGLIESAFIHDERGYRAGSCFVVKSLATNIEATEPISNGYAEESSRSQPTGQEKENSKPIPTGQAEESDGSQPTGQAEESDGSLPIGQEKESSRSRPMGQLRESGRVQPHVVESINSDSINLNQHNQQQQQQQPENELAEILCLLDFLEAGERDKRAKQKHVTLKYAQAWREWWDRQIFDKLDNPAGFANSRIRQEYLPPQNNSDYTEILRLLDFLEVDELHKRAKQKHVMLKYAQAWREWWDRRNFGSLDDPAGFANSQIRQGHLPPSQLALPGGAFEVEQLSPVTSPPLIRDVWAETQSILRPQMTRATYDAVIRGTILLGNDGSHYVIGVSTEMARDWLENRLKNIVARALATVIAGPVVSVEFKYLEQEVPCDKSD